MDLSILLEYKNPKFIILKNWVMVKYKGNSNQQNQD